MKRTGRLLQFAAIAVLASMLAALGCSKGARILEPVPDVEPVGAVVAGTVHEGAGGTAQGAVLTLEKMTNGVSATVRAARAAAAAGADVTGSDPAPLTTVSDRDGRFAFLGVQPGTYLLTASARNHAAGIQNVVVRSQAAETTFVDIAIVPTGTLHGTVRLENAIQHSNAIVYVEGTSYVAVSDPAGDYRLFGVPIGAWPIRGTRPGFLDDTTSAALAFAGDSTLVDTLYLRLDSNIAPTVTIATSTYTIAGGPTEFTATATDVDGFITLYEWDFEDDGVWDFSSAGPTATHVYSIAGPARAKVRVTDDQGGIALAAKNLSIALNDPPSASASAEWGAFTGVTMRFIGTGSDLEGTPTLFEWDLEDDGTFEFSSPTALTVTGRYLTAGVHVARLRVTDNAGATATDTVRAVVVDAIHVATSGSDANTGAYTSPLLRLSTALALAAPGQTIIMASGSYTEPATFELKSGVSIFGGYQLSNWVQQPAASSVISSSAATAVVARGALGSALVRWLDLRSAAASGLHYNSIALRCSVSSSITFRSCRFQAANGRNGSTAGVGTAGLPGASGSNGANGTSGGGGGGQGGLGGSLYSAGGAGGFGGYDGPGSPGNPGASGGGFGGSGGAGSVVCFVEATNGSGGVAGVSGSTGAAGSQPSSGGALAGPVWIPATSVSGAAGTNGRGGGGGGGGGGGADITLSCNGDRGGGGGGGGGGGQGGSGASSGDGGGASFAVWLHASSTTVAFDSCTFVTANGGNGGGGGNGGAGGSGGTAGVGGLGPDDAATGGSGAAGGAGGTGGSGAGGTGGPSVCVAYSVTAPTLTAPSYTVGFPGNGGVGGTGAVAGLTGRTGTVSIFP